MVFSRWYPIDGPELQTQPNNAGQSFTFIVTAFAFQNKRARVYGQDERGVWCQVEYKFKEIPKWLRRGMKEIGKM